MSTHTGQPCSCPDCPDFSTAMPTGIAELTEMLTAATDTAMQRGKRIDQLEKHLRDANITIRTLVGVDGG